MCARLCTGLTGMCLFFVAAESSTTGRKKRGSDANRIKAMMPGNSWVAQSARRELEVSATLPVFSPFLLVTLFHALDSLWQLFESKLRKNDDLKASKLPRSDTGRLPSCVPNAV